MAKKYLYILARHVFAMREDANPEDILKEFSKACIINIDNTILEQSDFINFEITDEAPEIVSEGGL
jgi:hypothetical protein